MKHVIAILGICGFFFGSMLVTRHSKYQDRIPPDYSQDVYGHRDAGRSKGELSRQPAVIRWTVIRRQQSAAMIDQ
jgi:hypothetical protein